jgi:ferric enterobactin receptor
VCNSAFARILSETIIMKHLLSALLLLVMATGFKPDTRIISGTVTDEYGYPISGASVLVKGSGAGTTTHVDGGFRITIGVKENVVLQVTAVGFETKEIKIGAGNFYRVKLFASRQALSEVVVGGAAKEKNSTGIVTIMPGPARNH